MPAPYDRWVERWRRSLDAAESHRSQSHRLEIDRPATLDEVAQVEAEIAGPLPRLFRRTLIEFSRRVEFFWFLFDGDEWTTFEGVWCGGCNWDLGRLGQMTAEARSMANVATGHQSEEVWAEKLPFHGIASGDRIAIDLAPLGSQPVVYLSNEFDLSPAHGTILGTDFYTFMDRWTAIGCPDDVITPRFLAEGMEGDNFQLQHVGLWCDWFGLPRPDPEQSRG